VVGWFTPAIVSGAFGQGKVIYISTGSFQVWQDNPDLLGSDELALRLLYNEKGGAEAVNAMLSYADKIYQEDQKERIGSARPGVRRVKNQET
jgi:hypothetical protein